MKWESTGCDNTKTHWVTENTKIKRITITSYASPRNQANQDTRCDCTFFQFHPSCLWWGQMGKDGKKSNLPTYLSDLEGTLVLKWATPAVEHGRAASKVEVLWASSEVYNHNISSCLFPCQDEAWDTWMVQLSLIHCHNLYSLIL